MPALPPVPAETATGTGAATALASGEAHFSLIFAGPLIIRLDAGIHVGCFELFGTDRVRTIRDLKRKTVAVEDLQSSQHVFLSRLGRLMF